MPSVQQITTKLYKHYSGVADTRTSRDFFEEAYTSSFNVRPDQLWMYGDQIPRPTTKSDPNYAKIKAFKHGQIWPWQKDESTVIPVFTKYENYPLTMIDKGTDKSFKLVYIDGENKGEQIRNIIPFNYALDTYNYYLTTKDGRRIYFGVGDWQLDTFSGILTFYGDVPEGVNHDNPPVISFYQYTGGMGFRQDTYGFDGATLPIENWHIDKGVYRFSTNSNDNTNLFETISRLANKVEDGFASTYGWDGADKNEGIALSLEKIIALEYTFTKDKVKGYDDSTDAEIGTLLSDKYAIGGGPFNISFVSQGITNEDHIIKVENGQASFDGGKAKTITTGIYKLPNATEDGFIILEADSIIPDDDYRFSVDAEPQKTQALLLYWNKTTQEYLPFVTKEENDCNFGFTIVAINGKIPPSVTMDSAAISAYSDSITPDYYGPRNYSVTVAVEGEYSTKSADYVVKNKAGFYLNDIIKRIISDFTIIDPDTHQTKLVFKGAIFLRAGNYYLSESLDLSAFDNLALLGETGGSTSLTGVDTPIIYNGTEPGVILLRDLSITGPNISFNSTKTQLVLRNITSTGDLTIANDANNIAVMSSSFAGKVSIMNTSDTREEPLEDGRIVAEITHSIVGELDIDAGHIAISGVTSDKASFKEHKDVIVNGCFFQSVLEKPTIVQLRGCVVRQFAASIPRREIPNTGMFPIYSKENDQYLQYASFANHFTYDDLNNEVYLNIDKDFLFWKSTEVDGVFELSCHIDASQITVDDVYDRDPNYDGEPTHTGETLQGALKDLYLTKADLVGGKVPLTELPDSVAYGGLLYIGSWAFDVNNGRYPTFEETMNEHPYLSLDLKVDDHKLQPGWFWVVASSTEIEVDNPVSDQYSALQYVIKDGKVKVVASNLDGATIELIEKLTEEQVNEILGKNREPDEDPSELENMYSKYFREGGLVFTAGDWVIWNGTFFEKLDRAYQDPVYSILPVYTTGDNSDSPSGRICWYWKQSRDSFENGWGLGALDLSKKTIGEAFDEVNQELKRLQVKHPSNISELDLLPIREYGTTNFRRIKNRQISSEIESAYDLNIDAGLQSFRVQTPRGSDWKSLFYFGDYGEVTGYLDKDVESHEITATSNAINVVYDEETGKPLSMMNIDKPIDPYKNEFVGEGYYVGTRADIGPIEPLGEGSHTFKIAVTKAGPNHPIFMKGVVSSTKPYVIELIKPTGLDAAMLDDVAGRRTLVEQDILDAEVNGYCSGVKSIKIKNNNGFKFTLTYTIKSALKEFANVDSDKWIKVYSNIDETLKTPMFFLIPSEDNPDMLSYAMSRDFYTVTSDKVFDEFRLHAIIYDVYGNSKTFNDIFKYSIRFDPTVETERVFSGNTLYPKYLPGQREACGNNEWDSRANLTESVYNYELQKVGRNITVGERTFAISEYKWPSGRYLEYDALSGVDYTNVTSGLEIGDDTYRFVTLTQFGHDEDHLSEVILDNNSGFTLKIHVADDEINNWKCDPYSISTNDLILQAKIISPAVVGDGDPSITKWIDCNSPYDGFLTVGDMMSDTEDCQDGDPAMYAGKSNATVKRITFGRSVYSGKLIIRVGIKKDSNLSFRTISIGDLI